LNIAPAAGAAPAPAIAPVVVTDCRASSNRRGFYLVFFGVDMALPQEYFWPMRHWWQQGNFPMKKRMTIEDLAVMVQQGFTSVERRLTSLEFGQKSLAHSQKTLEQGQEDIKLRLDQHAHRFELVELQRRVGRIENHIGLGK